MWNETTVIWNSQPPNAINKHTIILPSELATPRAKSTTQLIRGHVRVLPIGSGHVYYKIGSMVLKCIRVPQVLQASQEDFQEFQLSPLIDCESTCLLQ